MSSRPTLLLRKNTGQSVVELAILLPMLVVLALGLFDYARAIQANNTIVNLSREGANLALRLPSESASHEDIMNSLAFTAQWPKFETDGVMFITEVRKVSGVLTIPSKDAWSKNAAGAASQISADNVANKLPGVEIEEGGSVYIFEVGCTYQSLFMPYSPQLYATSVF